jgi:hypothetical protein
MVGGIWSRMVFMDRRPRWAQLFCLLIVLAAMAGWTGCAAWRPSLPMIVPEPMAGRALPGKWPAERIVPIAQAEAYDAEFTPLPKVQAQGNLILDDGRWWWRRMIPLRFYYVALDSDHVRLRGLPPVGPALFDVFVAEGRMTVLLHSGGAGGDCFIGPIAPGQSPFGQIFGMEPWDLSQVFTIGQRVAAGQFREKKRFKTIRLIPTGGESDDGLARVDLDARTSLPRRAWWEKGQARWEARYLEWAYFTDDQVNAPPRLMPRHIEIRRHRPRTILRLKVDDDKYRFSPGVPPRVFEWQMGEGWRYHTLEKLTEVLNP